MIIGLRHRGLRRLHQRRERRHISAEYVDKVADILDRLDSATNPQELDLPGFRLHQLGGDLAGHWSVTVTANVRITFRFDGGDATAVNLVDYH